MVIDIIGNILSTQGYGFHKYNYTDPSIYFLKCKHVVLKDNELNSLRVKPYFKVSHNILVQYYKNIL